MSLSSSDFEFCSENFSSANRARLWRLSFYAPRIVLTFNSTLLTIFLELQARLTHRFLARGIELLVFLIHVHKIELFQSHAQRRNGNAEPLGQAVQVAPLRAVDLSGLLDDDGARHENGRRITIDGTRLVRGVSTGVDLPHDVAPGLA